MQSQEPNRSWSKSLHETERS
uniref:Uncharacterized protein n=1 Tax=Arundo donax TaxID=35708 RepID=A0A0A8Y0V4_ARUDO